MTYVSFRKTAGRPVTGTHIIRKHIRDSLGFYSEYRYFTNRLLQDGLNFTKPDPPPFFPKQIPQKMGLFRPDLFMVGKSSARTLELLGIKTIGDLALTDPAILTSHLKSHGQTIWEYANRLEYTPHRRETSYLQRHWEFHNPFLRCHRTGRCPESASVSFRVRLFPAAAAGQLAGMVSVEIKFHNFHTVSHQTLLRTPSQSTDTIYSYACRLFDELWDGTPIRLLGIRTSKLSGQDTVQMNLLNPETSQKLRKLDKALDDIRRKGLKTPLSGAAFLNKSKQEILRIRSEHLRKIPVSTLISVIVSHFAHSLCSASLRQESLHFS